MAYNRIKDPINFRDSSWVYVRTIRDIKPHKARKCTVCGASPALRIVKKQAFCKAHTEMAWQLQARMADDHASMYMRMLSRRVEVQDDAR